MPYTDDDLLDALQEYAAEHGSPPTTREADADDALPNPSTFRDHFGNWNAAIEQAGLEPHHRRRSDEELLDALREYAADHDGRPPTMVEANEAAGFPSPGTFQARFGSWNVALEAAGLSLNNRNWSDEKLLAGLRAFADEHGHAPTTADVAAAEVLPGVSTFRHYFDSWNAALEAAGLAPEQSRSEAVES